MLPPGFAADSLDALRKSRLGTWHRLTLTIRMERRFHARFQRRKKRDLARWRLYIFAFTGDCGQPSGCRAFPAEPDPAGSCRHPGTGCEHGFFFSNKAWADEIGVRSGLSDWGGDVTKEYRPVQSEVQGCPAGGVIIDKDGKVVRNAIGRRCHRSFQGRCHLRGKKTEPLEIAFLRVKASAMRRGFLF